MAFIRRVRTASGATAVQIAEYAAGRQRIVKHVGSAHTDAELGLLLERARELMEDPAQGQLELGVEPTPRVLPLVGIPSERRVSYPSRGRAAGPAGQRLPGTVAGGFWRPGHGCSMTPCKR